MIEHCQNTSEEESETKKPFSALTKKEVFFTLRLALLCLRNMLLSENTSEQMQWKAADSVFRLFLHQNFWEFCRSSCAKKRKSIRMDSSDLHQDSLADQLHLATKSSKRKQGKKQDAL